jgi:hypothetical protein
MNHRFRMREPSSRPRRILVIAFVAVALALGVLVLAAAEALLRLAGDRPATALPEFLHDFYADDEGVFRADPAIWRRRGVQVNSEGFRGEEFRPRGDLPSALVLGDSFAWGADARPLAGNAFVDLIGRAGYVTYNTGVPGVGTNQYAYLARKYVPRLRPNWVVVAFFVGNDFSQFPMLPGNPPWHIPVCGPWLPGFREGHPVGPHESYRHWYGVDPAECEASVKGRVRCALSATVLGARAYQALARLKAIRSSWAAGTTHAAGAAPQVVLDNLGEIQSVARAHGARFLLVLIPPDPGGRSEWSLVSAHAALAPFGPKAPTTLVPEDWTTGIHPHFTNSGHAKFAQFVLSQLN